MAYYRTVLKGSLGSVETWSTSTNWGVVGLSPDVPDQAAVDGMLSRLLTYTTTVNMPPSMRQLMSTGGSADGWRVEKRAEDETILSIAEGAMASIAAGTGTPTKTPQDALVISLRTNTPGARGRGRMYWPALGAGLSSQFQILQPTPQQAADDAKIWLTAIQTQLNSYFISIADARRVRLSVRSVTDHACRDVVQLQCGSILDTQRRRRDALVETYVSAVFP